MRLAITIFGATLKTLLNSSVYSCWKEAVGMSTAIYE